MTHRIRTAFRSSPLRRFGALAAAACLLAASPPPAAADDVADALAAALAAWQSGDAALARSEAEYALAKIAEADAGGLADFLPAALPGWTRSEAQSQAAGALMGGTLVATADYAGPEGDRLSIVIAADGPMFAAMSAMFSNPAAMSSMGKLARLGAHRAVISTDGDVNALVGRAALVQVSGDAPEEVKLAHLRAMDLDGLAAR